MQMKTDIARIEWNVGLRDLSQLDISGFVGKAAVGVRFVETVLIFYGPVLLVWPFVSRYLVFPGKSRRRQSMTRAATEPTG